MSYATIVGPGFDSWVKAVRGSVWRSMHFWLVVIFNLNVALGTVNCSKVWSRMQGAQVFLFLAILLIVVVMFIDSWIYSLLKNTRDSILKNEFEGNALNGILGSTYLAYRMGIVAIGTIGCCFHLLSFSFR